MTTINAASQLSNNDIDPQISVPASPPFAETQRLVTIRLTRCVAQIPTAVIVGMTIAAVRSLEITVSASVAGIDRQNRMLLSLRSA